MANILMEALKALKEDTAQLVEDEIYSNEPKENTKYVVRWVTLELLDEEEPEHYFFGEDDLEKLKADFIEFIKPHLDYLEFAEIYEYDNEFEDEPYKGKPIYTFEKYIR